MFKILSALFLFFFLASCAAKSPTVTPPTQDQDKARVLQLLKERTREFCAYDGKVRVGLNGAGGTQKASGLLKINCEGNASLTVLGPFGIVLEEFILKDGVFTTASGEWTERDISSSAYSYALKSALRIPPLMPKPSYNYEDLHGSFLFEGEGYRIWVNDAYRISGVEALSYKAQYTYLEEMPTSATVSLPCNTSSCTTITVDFLEAWK